MTVEVGREKFGRFKPLSDGIPNDIWCSQQRIELSVVGGREKSGRQPIGRLGGSMYGIVGASQSFKPNKEATANDTTLAT